MTVRMISEERLEAFADRLSQLRMRSGLSQSEIGRRIGCSSRAVGYWEAGEHVPPADFLAGLADVFGVSMSFLWSGRKECGCDPSEQA